MTEHVDITELFARDPMSLTDDDIDKIIAEMRKKRHLFKAAPKTGNAPKKTAKEEKVAGLSINLDLGL